MFNGIIYNTGLISKITKNKNSSEITLKSNLLFKTTEVGNSLSCNGTCLTITRIKGKFVSFYLSKETLVKTIFKYAKIGNVINIEKSLIYGNKISGHYIQGHVDTTGKVSIIKIVDKTWIITFDIPKTFKKYLIEKGSISINGVSLTISKIMKNKFEINIIPHTLKLTNIINLKKNDFINIELDIFGKYFLKLNK